MHIFFSCLLSNTALGFGVEVIARLEQRNVGILWSNVFDNITLDEPIHLGWVLALLALDCVIYMTIAW